MPACTEVVSVHVAVAVNDNDNVNVNGPSRIAAI